MKVLIDEVIKALRAGLTQAQAEDILPYGGDFSAEEVKRVSFNCPAVLVASSGFVNGYKLERLTGRGARATRMAAFVVTRQVTREERMLEATALAELVMLVLERWSPACTELYEIGAPEIKTLRAENLYSEKVDKMGLALWCVDWVQGAQARPEAQLAQLSDLLSVEITDTVRHTSPPTEPVTFPPITVTEDVQFAPVTPPSDPV